MTTAPASLAHAHVEHPRTSTVPSGSQTALFWIALGAFLGTVGTPLVLYLVEGVVALVLAWRGERAAASVVWTLLLGVPFAFFAVLLGDLRGRVRWALQWAERPAFRVALLVASAIIVASFRALIDIDALDVGGKSGLPMAALEQGSFVLAMTGPIAIGALLLGLRAGGAPSSSPILWLFVGCFASVVGFELGTFAWNVALFAGARAGLGSRGIQCLVWLVTLATPPLCLSCAIGWFHRRTRSLVSLVRARLFTALLVVLAGAAIFGWVAIGPLHRGARDLLASGAYDDAREARALASIVTGCLMPLAVGALVLRLRRAVDLRTE